MRAERAVEIGAFSTGCVGQGLYGLLMHVASNLVPVREAYVLRYGIMRASTSGSSSQGTFSRTLTGTLASIPALPPTKTSTASTTSPSTLMFFPSNPMSATAWLPQPAGQPDQ